MERLIDLDLLQVRSVLPILLQDRTTNQNIIWATDTYEACGEGYGAKEPITAALVTGANNSIIQPRIAKTVSDQADRTKKHAEVFTPAWICNMMVNHCDEVWFGRKDVFNTSEEKTWTPTEAPIAFPKRKRWQRYVDSRRLEITCGEAPYLVSRYDASTGELIPFNHRIGMLDRKLRVVNENAADETEWLKFAFRALESVYGFEYQGDNLLIARVNVLLTFIEAVHARWQREATLPELQRAAKIISWNLWQMDGLKGIVPYTSLQEANAQVSMWELLGEMQPAETKRPECRIYDWRGQGKLTYNDRMTRKGKEMKFDFVIGNPPYQEESTRENGYASPVYNRFLDEAYKIGEKVEMIHPARFLFNAGSTPKEWNKKMLNDPHFKVLHYEKVSSNIFRNTDIKGGIAISYRDATRNFGAIETFTNHEELNSILKKIRSMAISPISDVAYVTAKFNFDKLLVDVPQCATLLKERRLATNVLDILDNIVFFAEQPNDQQEYVHVFGRIGNSRAYRWIRRDYIDLPSNIDKFKVFLPKVSGNGSFGEVFSDPIVGTPGEINTHTFMSIGALETRDEGIALLKYVKTKFARAMLGILKITQHNSNECWKYVPLQDFTPASDIDWSASIADIDRQLYRKYGLTEEEIAFIETKVKEMA